MCVCLALLSLLLYDTIYYIISSFPLSPAQTGRGEGVQGECGRVAWGTSPPAGGIHTCERARVHVRAFTSVNIRLFRRPTLCKTKVYNFNKEFTFIKIYKNNLQNICTYQKKVLSLHRISKVIVLLQIEKY